MDKNYNQLLATLLDCGTMDLNIFDHCEIDFDEMIDYLHDNFGKNERITMNNLAWAMFQIALYDFQKAIDQRIDEIDEMDNNELTEEQQEEFSEIKSLNIFDDTESFHNYLDTGIYFTKNQELYEKYFSNEIEGFENSTGFSLI